MSVAVARRLEVDLVPLRRLGGAMLALGLVLPHLPGDPGLPCPLRSATGVPCPFCGLTTSVKAALHGDVHGAVSANPFGMLVVVAAVVLLVRPSLTRVSIPVWTALTVAGASWLFELHRFHFW